MGRLISDKFKEWQAECDERFGRLKANEERLNSIFNDAYGLNDELTPQVEDSLVSVRRAVIVRETLEKQNNANLRGRIYELEDFEIKLSRQIGQGTAINPDDGIIANYSRFQDVLAKIYQQKSCTGEISCTALIFIVCQSTRRGFLRYPCKR